MTMPTVELRAGRSYSPPFLGRLCFCHVMDSLCTRLQPLPAPSTPEPGCLDSTVQYHRSPTSGNEHTRLRLPAVGFPGVAQEPGGPHAADAATCDLPQTSGARPVFQSES
jgi:hypothetical protein